MRNDSGIKVFAGSGSLQLVEKICSYLGVSPGKNFAKRFTDSNTYVKIEEKIRGMDVYVVQTIGLDSNNEFMELLFWIDAFRRSGANSVTAIIPYFGYAKGDKKDEPRVSIRARVCADCLESAGVSRIVTMDLHSPQIQGFFKIPVDHLYASKIFIEHIKGLNLGRYTVVATDAGFAKNAKHYSNKLGVSLAIGNKQRLSHDEKAEVLGIIGNVSGVDAVIVDDFTITCGTLIEAARLLKENGAKDIYAYVSHCLLNSENLQALIASPIKRLITTDTVHNPAIAGCDRIEILSVSGMFGKSIGIIHESESLSMMFEE